VAVRYDALIIGSGIGGLCCGAFLAKAGMRVLVLEQHSKIGGYAHGFRRRNFSFESGIHSIPMADEGFIMHVLRLLGLETAVERIELPEMFCIANPLGTVTIPSRKEQVIDYLNTGFPGQRAGIAALQEQAALFYGNIVKPLLEAERGFTPENREFVSRFHNKSYKEFIDGIITDEKLRHLFYGQWPYVGSSPEYAPALFFFMMFMMHFIEGSHVCKGGFSTLADALASYIKGRGGEVATKSRVAAVSVENSLVTRAITDRGEEYEAPLFVSNISPYILHNALIPEPFQGKRWKRRLASLSPSASCVAVYLGMKPGINSLVTPHISFWYPSLDNEKIFSNVLRNKKDGIDHLILLKSSHAPEYPTLTLMNFVLKSFSSDWKSDKMRIADMMVKKAEELYPGLRSCIEVMEVGSPATFERYTANTGGSLYGFENTRLMYGEAKIPVTTHLPNLFQVGHWGKPGGGIWNVMSNAYAASKMIIR